MDKAEEPGTGGVGGGTGGNTDDDQEPVPTITPAAISYSFDQDGDYVLVDTTTSAAISTTGSAIYVKIVTYGDEVVTIGHSTTSSAIVTPTAIEATTQSAIGGGLEYAAVVPLDAETLDEEDNIFIHVTINDERYILHIIKEANEEEPDLDI